MSSNNDSKPSSSSSKDESSSKPVSREHQEMEERWKRINDKWNRYVDGLPNNSEEPEKTTTCFSWLGKSKKDKK